jgi:hypothetical protein
VGQAENIERALPTSAHIFGAGWLEPHQASLLRMHGALEAGKPLGQDRQNPAGVIFPFAPDDESSRAGELHPARSQIRT